MFFLLALLTTGILGFFMPQWVYEMSWQQLFEMTNTETTSAKINQLIKDLGLTTQTAAEVATERIWICIAISFAIFLALTILFSIIKKLIKKL